MKVKRSIIIILSIIVCLFTFSACNKIIINEPEYYTITFITNGGIDQQPLNVKSGTIPNITMIPSKEKWFFENWYTDEEQKSVYIPAEIYSDLTLYAKWSDGGLLTNQNILTMFKVKLEVVKDIISGKNYLTGYFTAKDDYCVENSPNEIEINIVVVLFNSIDNSMNNKADGNETFNITLRKEDNFSIIIEYKLGTVSAQFFRLSYSITSENCVIYINQE